MSINELQKIISGSDNIVFFGGAGVSTESGIPDFRSADGLYSQRFKYSPETMLGHRFFETHTEEFFDFYRKKVMCLDAQPNAAHRKLAALEKEGRLKAVVTQNIDGLHKIAGSVNVYELHGSMYRNFCLQCGRSYGARFVKQSKGVPLCPCGGVIKPDVVLYGEGLDDTVVQAATDNIAHADVLIIGGTSLVVYPAAGLINYFKGSRLVLINKSPTPHDKKADLVINGSIGDVLDQIVV